MRVDGAIANLLQGISQQQPQNRLPGQCTHQVNAVNDVVDGWKRRPPTEFLATLLGIDSALALKWHFYNTGLEQYLLCITSAGAIHIFDLAGNAHTAVMATGTGSRLAFTDPDDLSLVTVGDYTIIANAKHVPAMKAAPTEEYTSTALVYLKDGGEYGRAYTVTLDGAIVAEYVTPGGSDPANESKLTGTEYVTSLLYGMLAPAADKFQGPWEFAHGAVSNGLNSFALVRDGSETVSTAARNAAGVQAYVYTLTYTVSNPITASVLYLEGGTFISTRVYLDETAGTHTVDITCNNGARPLVFSLLYVGSVTISGVTLVAKELVYSSPALLNYTYSLAGSVIEIKRITGTADIDVLVSDDRGGQFAKVIQRITAKPGDLPKYATPGHIVQVVGDAVSDKDDYYLKFTIESGAQEFGVSGIWRECCQPDLPQSFDTATMPHALIRMPDMSWLFTELDGSTVGTLVVEKWRLRSSGSNLTNPVPSFVGKAINCVGMFQDRLYLLSDENASFSATNSYFNYFNKTATTILDSDPVDMPSAGNSVVKLRRAVQHDKNLVIFAGNAQFVVPGTRELTPKSSMVLTTSYESDARAQPVPAGVSLLFPITYGDYAGVREFITAAASDTNSAQPITAHVPKLIEGHIKHMVVSSNFDVVLMQSTQGLNKLYVYKYLWQDGTRQQASWGVWEFNADLKVSTVFIKDAGIYVVFEHAGTFRLERMDLTDVPPAAMPYNIFVDSRVSLTTATTVLTLPYTAALADLVVIQGAGSTYPGQVIPVVSLVGNALTLGAIPSGPCFVGLSMKSLLSPTMPMIKDSNGGLISSANLIIGKFTLAFKDTGSLTATVRSKHYPDFVVQYSGRILGSPVNVIGAPVIDSGVLEIAVRKDSKLATLDLETSTHLPMKIMSIEWDGDYTKRGRRL